MAYDLRLIDRRNPVFFRLYKKTARRQWDMTGELQIAFSRRLARYFIRRGTMINPTMVVGTI